MVDRYRGARAGTRRQSGREFHRSSTCHWSAQILLTVILLENCHAHNSVPRSDSKYEVQGYVLREVVLGSSGASSGLFQLFSSISCSSVSSISGTNSAGTSSSTCVRSQLSSVTVSLFHCKTVSVSLPQSLCQLSPTLCVSVFRCTARQLAICARSAASSAPYAGATQLFGSSSAGGKLWD